MKPNPWMSPSALYANHDTRGAWSTFEDYTDLISILFLAAKDEEVAATDGYTLETRVEQFIAELALIARAHNLDNSRITASLKSEEYDDFEGDKPSCYSGVKRRLFQSVQGHPLLKILTAQDIDQELHDFVRKYFIEHIHSGNSKKLLDAWQEIIATSVSSQENQAILMMLNISESAQAEFVKYLRVKYSDQFDMDLSFTNHIQSAFKITPLLSSHAAKFGGTVNLLHMLEQAVEAIPHQHLLKDELRRHRLQFYNSSKESQIVIKETTTPLFSRQALSVETSDLDLNDDPKLDLATDGVHRIEESKGRPVAYLPENLSTISDVKMANAMSTTKKDDVGGYGVSFGFLVGVVALKAAIDQALKASRSVSSSAALLLGVAVLIASGLYVHHQSSITETSKEKSTSADSTGNEGMKL